MPASTLYVIPYSSSGYGYSGTTPATGGLTPITAPRSWSVSDIAAVDITAVIAADITVDMAAGITRVGIPATADATDCALALPCLSESKYGQ